MEVIVYFLLLYKVQFLWVHESCGDCSPMVVIVYFILLYKIQFLLVHECQQKPIIIFYFQICCGDCSPMVVIVTFLLLYKVQFLLVDELILNLPENKTFNILSEVLDFQ